MEEQTTDADAAAASMEIAWEIRDEQNIIESILEKQ
jgi:hypothetical protein